MWPVCGRLAREVFGPLGCISRSDSSIHPYHRPITCPTLPGEQDGRAQPLIMTNLAPSEESLRCWRGASCRWIIDLLSLPRITGSMHLLCAATRWCHFIMHTCYHVSTNLVRSKTWELQCPNRSSSVFPAIPKSQALEARLQYEGLY